MTNTTTNVYRNGGKDDDIATIKMTFSIKMLLLKQTSEVPPLSSILPSHVLHVSTHHWLPWCDLMGEACNTHHRFY
jgi:hypothetical protein